MKILIILCSDKMLLKYLPNIQILKKYMDEYETIGHTVDYACISSRDDISNYESVISFKYKIINLKRQLSKVCDFLKDEYFHTKHWMLKGISLNIIGINIDFTGYKYGKSSHILLA